jgi:hypothetical protein
MAAAAVIHQLPERSFLNCLSNTCDLGQGYKQIM